jgi:tRNA pseudouridine38-40 synthase
MLPDDIRVSCIEPAPAQQRLVYNSDAHAAHADKPWHAIYCASGKLYSYRMSTTRNHDPQERLYRYHEWRAARFGFDIAAFERAVSVFVGTHDFTSFANAAPPAGGHQLTPVLRDPVRTVQRVAVIDEGGGRYRADFRITGALYKMVRNMVGAALAVGCGKLTVDDIVSLLEAKDRTLAPQSAPAHGLCLEEVHYVL